MARFLADHLVYKYGGRPLCGRGGNGQCNLQASLVSDADKLDPDYVCKRCAAKLADMRATAARKAGVSTIEGVAR